MGRFIVATILFVLVLSATWASVPGSGRVGKQFKPRLQERQTGVREDDFIPIVDVMPELPLHERLIEIGLGPVAPVVRYLRAHIMSDRQLPRVISER